jgi:hypothetical protein
MEAMVNSLGERGQAIRVCRPDDWQRRHRVRSSAWIALAAIAFGCPFLTPVFGQAKTKPQSAPSPQPAIRASADAKPAANTDIGSDSTADQPRPPAPARFKVRDEYGECVIARFHGSHNGNTALMLPDGQLGTPSRLVPTDDPFQPLTCAQLGTQLKQHVYSDYELLTTEHYLIFYKSTPAFAQDSGRVLEDLYKGLIEAFRRNKFPVHESEFPLVAVIFATETDFRSHKKVDPQVQAYYEFFTNRIFFYQKSERDQIEPKVAMFLKPQTVAHEGAHQVLSNIGLQPRPCAWPPWLVEGLAEYCATTVNTKKGIVWRGMGAINSLHMATLRELDDPLSREIDGADNHLIKVATRRAMAQTEALVRKTSLSPPDYAQAWALTHFLAQKQTDVFVKYLKGMSQLPPLEPRTPEQNLDEFRRYFSEDLARLDKKVADYIHKLSQKRTYDPLPYYSVIFAQPLGNGLVRRAATCSQSPQMIQQWVLEQTAPNGGEPTWEILSWPTRARAILAAEEWMRHE